MGETTQLKLGDIARVQGGFAFKSSDFGNTGTPVIKIGDVTGGGSIRYGDMDCVPYDIASAASNFKALPNDTLIAMTGANVGRVTRVRENDPPALINQRVGRFIPKSDLGYSKDYIHFLVSSKDAYEFFKNTAYGSAQPNISASLIERLPIPSYDDIQANSIASVLSSLDDKINLNQKMNETLEAMARDIFKDWFVGFGPTRTKMEGREPYLTADLWALFPERLDDEGKPEGWRQFTLRLLSDLNPESWSATSPPAQVEYVDLSNTKWGTIESTEFYEWSLAPSRARRILRPGDTIVGTVRPGNGSYSFISQNSLTGSTGFAVLRPKQPEYREIVYLAATSAENIERLAHLADGGAYPAIRPDVVADTQLWQGSETLVAAFSSTSKPLIERIEANKRENKTLAQTRDLLLSRLMSGELSVLNAETIL